MWIELHQTLPRSRKIMRLRRELKIKKPTAIGHMVLIWLWALDNATDGDLSGFTDEDIAEVAEFPEARAEEFVKALVSAELLDCSPDGSMLYIHNWEKYAGRLMEQNEIKRMQAAERQRRRRDKLRDSHAEECDSHAPTIPNLTIPNLTYIDDSYISAQNDAEKTAENRENVQNSVENSNSGAPMDYVKMALMAFKYGWKDAQGKKTYLHYAQLAYEKQGKRIDFMTGEVTEV